MYNKQIIELSIKLAPEVYKRISMLVHDDPNLKKIQDDDFFKWVARETINQAIAIHTELNRE